MGRRAADIVREGLEQLILTGELADGAHLDEVRLATRFDVSRTPLREALQALSASGLVELIPNRGAFVRNPGIQEMVEMFEVMAELEGMCGRLAARRVSETALAEIDGVAARCEDALNKGGLGLTDPARALRVARVALEQKRPVTAAQAFRCVLADEAYLEDLRRRAEAEFETVVHYPHRPHVLLDLPRRCQPAVGAPVRRAELALLGDQALGDGDVLGRVDRPVGAAAVVDLDDAHGHAVLQGAQLLQALGALQRAGLQRHEAGQRVRPEAVEPDMPEDRKWFLNRTQEGYDLLGKIECPPLPVEGHGRAADLAGALLLGGPRVGRRAHPRGRSRHLRRVVAAQHRGERADHPGRRQHGVALDVDRRAPGMAGVPPK